MAKFTPLANRSESGCNCSGAGFENLSAALDGELARMQQRIGEIASPRLTPADLGALADRCPQFGRIAELLDAAVRR
jgi:hypothetical protein